MGFSPISINEYLKMHIKNNPDEDKEDLRRRLNIALEEFKKGTKCTCGNDIWVIGSASAGIACFNCITGETDNSEDYEIDEAIKKKENKDNRPHIDDLPAELIAGIFDDDVYQINEALIKKPDLCLSCINNDDPNTQVICNLTRFDQKDNKNFTCYTYLQKT